MVELGQKVKKIPYAYRDSRFGSSDVGMMIQGTVVYINMAHRFYTVEFKVPGGKFRESFKFEGWWNSG